MLTLRTNPNQTLGEIEPSVNEKSPRVGIFCRTGYCLPPNHVRDCRYSLPPDHGRRAVIALRRQTFCVIGGMLSDAPRDRGGVLNFGVLKGDFTS